MVDSQVERQYYYTMTNKKFSVAGVSTLNGKTKLRFATDSMRIKTLAKNGHEDIDLVTLPGEMTKAEIARYLEETNFAKGRTEVLRAIRHTAKKNPLRVDTSPTAMDREVTA